MGEEEAGTGSLGRATGFLRCMEELFIDWVS